MLDCVMRIGMNELIEKCTFKDHTTAENSIGVIFLYKGHTHSWKTKCADFDEPRRCMLEQVRRYIKSRYATRRIPNYSCFIDVMDLL